MTWNVRDLLLLMCKNRSNLTLNLAILGWSQIEVVVALILQLIIGQTSPSPRFTYRWLLVDYLGRQFPLLAAADRSGLQVLTLMRAEPPCNIRFSAKRSSL